MTVLTNFLEAGLAWNMDRKQRGAREFGREVGNFHRQCGYRKHRGQMWF